MVDVLVSCAPRSLECLNGIARFKAILGGGIPAISLEHNDAALAILPFLHRSAMLLTSLQMRRGPAPSPSAPIYF